MIQPYDAAAASMALSAADRRLGCLIARVGPCEIEFSSASTPFQTLLRAIVHQQLSGRAAEAIHRRVLSLAPHRRVLTPARVAKLCDAELRSAGLSRAKVMAIQDLAARTLDGTVPSRRGLERLSDDEIVERLVVVRGIGRWTVEMLLMFYCARPDVLPVDDLGVRKGYMATYRTSKLPTTNELREYGERWRPYRSVASWYLWRAVDSAQPKPA